MLESKIEKRIEGRYEVIKECLETIYQQLSENMQAWKVYKYYRFIKRI